MRIGRCSLLRRVRTAGGGGGGSPLGNQSISIICSPDEGGGVILTAFKQAGSAAIGIHPFLSGASGGTSSCPTCPSVSSPSANSNASGSTFVIDLISRYDATTQASFTISDNKGNTYSKIATQPGWYLPDPVFSVTRFVCLNGVGGAGHIATVANTPQYEMTMFFIEITNCIALAGTSGATNSSVGAINTGATSPINSGNLNVTDTHAVLLGFCAGNGASPGNYGFSAAGYTQVEIEPATDNNHAQGALFYALK